MKRLSGIKERERIKNYLVVSKWSMVKKTFVGRVNNVIFNDTKDCTEVQSFVRFSWVITPIIIETFIFSNHNSFVLTEK